MSSNAVMVRYKWYASEALKHLKYINPNKMQSVTHNSVGYRIVVNLRPM